MTGADAARGSDLTTIEPPPPPSEPSGVATKGRRPKRARRILAVVLVVLFSISLLASVLATWTSRQVLNTDVFMKNMTTAIEEPAVQAALTTYISKEVVTLVDPQQRIADALPARAQFIAGPVAGAFDSLVHQSVQKLVANPTFQEVLLRAIRRAHETAIGLLEGKKEGNLILHGNTVVLNTLPLIDQTVRTIEQQDVLGNVLPHVPALSAPDGQPSAQLEQLSSRFGVTLPADFGQVVVFRSDTLAQAQSALSHLRRALIVLASLTGVLFILALVVAPRRRRTLAQLGIGVAVVMLLAWAATRWATNHVAELAKNQEGRAAISSLAHGLTSGLLLFVLLVALAGVIGALIAFLVGDSSSATRTRSSVRSGAARAPTAARSMAQLVAAHADGTRVVGWAVGFALLLLVGLNLAGVIVAIVVVAAWQVAVSVIEDRFAKAATAEVVSGD